MLKFLKMCSYQLYVPGSVPSLRAKRDLDPDQPAGHHAHHLPPQVTRVGAFWLIVQHRFTLMSRLLTATGNSTKISPRPTSRPSGSTDSSHSLSRVKSRQDIRIVPSLSSFKILFFSPSCSLPPLSDILTPKILENVRFPGWQEISSIIKVVRWRGMIFWV